MKQERAYNARMTIEHREEEGSFPDFLPTDLLERATRIDITSPESKALLSILAATYNEDLVTTAARAIGTAIGLELDLICYGGKLVRADFMGDRPVSPDDDTLIDGILEIDEQAMEKVTIPPLILNDELSDYLMSKANRLGITASQAFDRTFVFGLKVNYELSTQDRVSYIVTDSQGNSGILDVIDHGDNVVGQFLDQDEEHTT